MSFLKLSSKPSKLHRITLYEYVDINLLDKLIASDLLKENYTSEEEWDFGYENEKKQLMAYRDIISKGMAKVKYSKSLKTFGRVVPFKSLSLATIRRELRHTLAREIYVDIDVQNCHPEILYQVFKDTTFKTELLKDYITNRKPWLDMGISEYNVKKDDIKCLLLSFLNNGGYEQWAINRNITKPILPKYQEFKNEIKYLLEEIFNNNSDIYNEVKERKKATKKEFKNPIGSVSSFFLQEHEIRILECIYDYGRLKGYITEKSAVLCCDGIMILKEQYNNNILKEFSKIVKKELGFSLTFTQKEMNEDYLSILNDHIHENDKINLSLIDENDKIFWDKLEFISINDYAKIFYEMFPNKYITSKATKPSTWYEYDKYNVLREPSKILNTISNTLQQYLLIRKDRLRPNMPLYEDKIKLFNKCYKECGSAIDKIIKFLSELYNIDDIDNKFDSNINLIAFNNKVYDNSIKSFRDIQPIDFITKTTKYDYEEEDKIDKEGIKNLIKSIFGDKQVSKYYLQVKSRALFGNDNQEVFLLTGSGANGKSMMQKLEANALGEYEYSPSSTFLTSTFEEGKPNTSLIECMGRRILNLSEPAKGSKDDTSITLNKEFIKQMTGGDKLTARRLYGTKNLQFKATFTPFILCNNTPNIEDLDRATQRRMNVINYPFTFCENPKSLKEKLMDKKLAERCETDINFARSYMMVLLDHVINPTPIIKPDTVIEATKEYMEDNNPIKSFIETYYIETNSDKDRIRTSDIKSHYDSMEGRENVSIPNFIKLMKTNKFNNKMYAGIRYYINIKKNEIKEEIIKPSIKKIF